MKNKELRESRDADENLDECFGSLDIGHDIETGILEETKGIPEHIDIILAIDLNSTYPAASFIAPCAGYLHCTTLSVLEEMSKSKTASFAGFRYHPDASISSQFGPEWTKDFLSHCKTLLRLKVGKSLDYLRLQVSLTTRSDTSDRDKAMLAKAAEDAGFCTKDTVQIIPTIEALTIELIWDYLASHNNGALKFQNGDNILVVHCDGEVADIQSYSISLPTTLRGSTEFRVQMAEMACGETVDWGKMVDQQFTQWMQNKFGNSFLELPAKDTGPNSQLMLEFAKVRRDYKIIPGGLYTFPLKLKNPPDQAPYDADRHLCLIKDSQMEMFFRSAADSLYGSLARHHNTIRTIKMSINKIIFTGLPGSSPYAEQQVIEFGSTWAGILPRGSQASPDRQEGYFRVEITPEMTVRGAIHSNDPNLTRIHRSRAWYGFALRTVFADGDPEWSRVRHRFDDIERCSVGTCWLVRKNQFLDPQALGSKDAFMDFEAEEANCVSNLEVYRSDLNVPPRWVRLHENIPDPNMELVATAEVTFTREDFALGEVKLCSDQVRRWRLHFKAKLSWAYGNGAMRVAAVSADERVLGYTRFTFAEGRQDGMATGV